jgi:hypothetical protein
MRGDYHHMDESHVCITRRPLAETETENEAEMKLANVRQTSARIIVCVKVIIV